MPAGRLARRIAQAAALVAAATLLLLPGAHGGRLAHVDSAAASQAGSDPGGLALDPHLSRASGSDVCPLCLAASQARSLIARAAPSHDTRTETPSPAPLAGRRVAAPRPVTHSPACPRAPPRSA
jgi:hypothetical protein